MNNESRIPPDQMDLIERFIAAYNRIDGYLHERFDKDNTTPYRQLARDFARENPKIPGVHDLCLFADLRNSIIHGKTRPYRYLSVPLPDVVEQIERVRDYLLQPPRILKRISGKVEKIDEADSLPYVLGLMEDKCFSQFPVYHEGRFSGLLTENGIARWLAHYCRHEMSPVDLKDITVKAALRVEEKRHNCEFMPRTATIDEVISRFSENLELEAVLITNSGNKNEKPLGIVTPWDISKLRSAA